VQHHQLVTDAQRYLNSKDGKPTTNESSGKGKSTDTEKVKEEAKARLAVLEEQLKNYEEPPMVFDCLWFHNGNQWQIAIDVDGSGDLVKQGLLTEYHVNPTAPSAIGSFGKDSMLNFTVNIYDDGQILSIVTTSGTDSFHSIEDDGERDGNQATQDDMILSDSIVNLTIK
jgi:tripeptidyl-peptidase-2